MVNAIQELSNAPDGKYLISLSRTVCDFLLSYYKEDGKSSNIPLNFESVYVYFSLLSWCYTFLFNDKIKYY